MELLAAAAKEPHRAPAHRHTKKIIIAVSVNQTICFIEKNRQHILKKTKKQKTGWFAGWQRVSKVLKVSCSYGLRTIFKKSDDISFFYSTIQRLMPILYPIKIRFIIRDTNTRFDARLTLGRRIRRTQPNNGSNDRLRSTELDRIFEIVLRCSSVDKTHDWE